MADLMVSYAREDAAFVRRLAAMLETHERTTWIDWASLPPAAPVRQEIFDAIADASAVLLVLSPNWVESTYCRQEFDHALHLRKRLLPILVTPVDETKVPPQLGDINWIRFDHLPFEDGVTELLRAFSLDLERLRLHARLYRRAETWLPEKEASILLRGAELAEAEAWVASGRSGEGEPTPLHLQFIAASRAAETSRQRRQLTAVSAALAVTIVLAVTAFLLYRTSESRRLIGQSRLVASEASTRAATRLDDALLLASVAHDIAPTVEARRALLGLVGSHQRLDWMLHGATGGVEGVAMSPDGRFAAGGDSAGRVVLWNLETGQQVVTADAAGENDIVNAVEFDPITGELAAAGLSGVVRIFGTKTGTLLERRRWKAASPVQSLAHSPDGTLLAVGDLLGTVQILPARTLAAPLHTLSPLTEAPALALAFAPGSRQLAIGRGDQRISVHDLADVTRVVTIEQEGRIAALAFTAAGQTLVAAGDRRLRLWPMASAAPAARDVAVDQRILALASIDDGERLALGLDNGDVRVVSSDGKPSDVLAGHGGQVRSLAARGARLVAGSQHGRVLVWSLDAPDRFALATTAHRDDPSALAFSPSGELLASADYGARVALWDRERAALSVIALGEQLEDVDGVAFSPGGERLAVASEASGLLVWSVREGKVARPLDATLVGVSKLAFGPDASVLLAILADATVARVDVEGNQSTRQKPPQPLGRPMCAAIDASWNRLAFGTNDGYVAIIDARTGRHARTPMRIQPGEVMGLAFLDHRVIGVLADGTLFEWDPGQAGPSRLTASGLTRLTALALAPGPGIAAVGDADGRILLWDTRAWQRIAEPRAVHQQGVTELAFDRDGTTLASNSGDGQVALWRVDPAAWAALACRQANRPLGQQRDDLDLADVAECRSTAPAWRWRQPRVPPDLLPLTPRDLVPVDGRIIGN